MCVCVGRDAGLMAIADDLFVLLVIEILVESVGLKGTSLGEYLMVFWMEG